MKKILILSIILIAIGISLSTSSAISIGEDDFFVDASNEDGGELSFYDGEFKLQDVSFNIPKGYKENESERVLAERGDIKNSRYSLCNFFNGDKKIIIKVLFLEDDKEFKNITADSGYKKKTIGDQKGYYSSKKYDKNTSTFKYLKNGKIVEVNAPNDDVLKALIESNED